MKSIKFILVVALALFSSASLSAQSANPLNDNPDSIIGEYLVPDPGNDSKVEFTKNSDGTYNCKITWMESPIDPSTGKPWTDVKNPDKSLRSVPCIGLVLIKGLRYDPEKKVWNGAKVYDPNRGIKANATAYFDKDGQFCLKGKVLGIGETAHWKKLK
jgi:Uncharacterized protein conserved in bacteria (DUF2147).